MPPDKGLKIKNLNLKKTRNTELENGFQRSAASIEFQLQNPSKQALLVQPNFDFFRKIAALICVFELMRVDKVQRKKTIENENFFRKKLDKNFVFFYKIVRHSYES